MVVMTDMTKVLRGDFVKVEFPDEATGISEWMWVRVADLDYSKKVLFEILDNAPINETGNNIRLGTKLAISFSKILEHRKPSEF